MSDPVSKTTEPRCGIQRDNINFGDCSEPCRESHGGMFECVTCRVAITSAQMDAIQNRLGQEAESNV